MATFAAVFAYEVSSAGASAFEAAYGPEGDWARFFRGAEGYLGTELWHGIEGATIRRYLVFDRWRSASAYTAFLAANDDEYRRRSRATESLWLTETTVGRFEAP